MLFFGFTLLVNVCCTQCMKYTLKRERPERIPGTKRCNNLRAAENGTWSMPSGDSAAAAVFCVIVGMEMHLPWVFLSLPLVMLGRVYY